MGMFDTFILKKASILPDNKEGESVCFQTKCLDCNLDVYVIKDDFTVEKWIIDEESETIYEPNSNLSFIATIYSIEKERMQEYEIVIRGSKLVKSKKIFESGY